MKTEPTFDALSNGFQAKDDAIEKHLQPLLQKDSLDYLSFKHAFETGTISGGLRMALHKMLTSYSEASSIPLETLLDAFAKMATDTKRGCFYITKNVRTQKWRIQLTGIRKSFIGDDLRKLVMEAGEYVFTHTVQKEGEKVLQP